ncbi:MAG: hypothetical protein QNK04_01430 [Myxococcota bacterium]|nr:hypothetical protein [Myxococcota bacterium]
MALVVAFLPLVPAVAASSESSAQRDLAAELEREDRPDLARLWTEATGLVEEARAIERQRPVAAIEGYLGAARLYEALSRERPDLSLVWWHGARAWWAAGDTQPLDAVEARIRYFERADEFCARGLEADPDCAECMLWKFASMGRLGTTRGVWTAMRQVPEMAGLLDRGIALSPAPADGAEDSTLGNLHYSSAIFYRALPDWFWIGWILGVKGDKGRALEHSRTALSLHPARIDYQVEVGTQLLCLGTTRGDEAHLAEGKQVMRAALAREPETQDDDREIQAARIMLERPGKACGYSGDKWLEINGSDARRAASEAGLGSEEAVD